jgi:hypothetical protein
MSEESEYRNALCSKFALDLKKKITLVKIREVLNDVTK